MNSKVIIQMDGKRTRLFKPKYATIDNNNINAAQRHDNYHDFTFDYSYWSFSDGVGIQKFDENQLQHIATQEEVYNDLGMDVINCAFQGTEASTFSLLNALVYFFRH